MPSTRSEYPRNEHDLSSATVACEPLALMLLELVNPFGQTLYRASVIGATQLGGARPRI